MEVPENDTDLMSKDFYKKNYKGVTTGIESKLSKGDYRPAMEDDKKSGFEHFDAFGFDSEVGFDEQTDDEQPDDPTNTGQRS